LPRRAPRRELVVCPFGRIMMWLNAAMARL
jgi:hypothetical protein